MVLADGRVSEVPAELRSASDDLGIGVLRDSAVRHEHLLQTNVSDLLVAKQISARDTANVTTPRRSHRERVAESERRLLEQAVRLIAEKGFAQTSAAEIGQRAGFSREMVRARYGSKEALLASLLRETFEARLLPRWDSGASGAERVLAQVDGLRRELRRNPAALRAFFVLSFESVTPIQELRTWIEQRVGRYEEQTIAALRIGQSDGSVRTELDAAAEARRFIATGIGHAFRWTVTPDVFDYDAALVDWRDASAERWRP